MTQIPTTREREARYGEVFWRLWKRLLSHQPVSLLEVEGIKSCDPLSDPALDCKLGREPPLRRSNKCSTCPVDIELEIDHAVARLISDKVIQSSKKCPYLVFTAALIAVLWFGSEAEETAKQSERIRIKELNSALEHINRALKTLSPDREGIEYLAVRADEELFTRLADVFRAETLISKAVKFLNENFERNCGHKLDPKKLPPAKRGRRPAGLARHDQSTGLHADQRRVAPRWHGYRTASTQRRAGAVPKTKNGEPRPVFLPPHLVAALRTHPRGLDRPGERVFRFSKNGYIYRLLREAAAKAGVTLPKRAAFHIFRHTYGTWLRRYAGMDTRGLVGTGAWKDRKSAERYTHVVVSEEAKRAALLPAPDLPPLLEERVKSG
jgi:hypothetical protein